MDNLDKKWDYNAIMSDRNLFNKTVYTPLSEAIKILEERQKDKKLKEYVKNNLPFGVPEIFKKGERYAFLSRPLATPNNESFRFLNILNIMNGFTPIFWEYKDDKFTPNMNEVKYNFAKMTFYFGKGKNGGEKNKKIRIVDFNIYEGKKISQVKTIWGQDLSDFHKELFEKIYSDSLPKDTIFFDASNWYKHSGLNVKIYYKFLFMLFLTHGILFENFMIDNKEENLFIKDVFLPAFLKILKETGKKPLIVPLEPLETEGSNFLMCYTCDTLNFIKNKLNMLK